MSGNLLYDHPAFSTELQKLCQIFTFKAARLPQMKMRMDVWSFAEVISVKINKRYFNGNVCVLTLYGTKLGVFV